MNKRKPPSRGRERDSGRPRDLQQDQRHKPHRHEAGRRSDRAGGSSARGHREEPRREHAQEQRQPGGPYWLYGHHAVTAALANPERKILRLAHAGIDDAPAVEGHAWEQVPRDVLESWLPPGAVHQGLAAKVHPLPDRGIEDAIAEADSLEHAQVMILDQVTDPQNVGAILRSAAAFGALAVILTERHAAPESGALAKAASGALEHVPLIRVANLARALELLKKGGFWIAGPRIYTYKELLETIGRHLGVRRVLVPVPFAIWQAVAGVAELLPRPPITRNQVALMRIDNLAAPRQPGFDTLGIQPRGLETARAAR